MQYWEQPELARLPATVQEIKRDPALVDRTRETGQNRA